jgi:hypothetical protein
MADPAAADGQNEFLWMERGTTSGGLSGFGTFRARVDATSNRLVLTHLITPGTHFQNNGGFIVTGTYNL